MLYTRRPGMTPTMLLGMAIENSKTSGCQVIMAGLKCHHGVQAKIGVIGNEASSPDELSFYYVHFEQTKFYFGESPRLLLILSLTSWWQKSDRFREGKFWER